MVTRHMAIQPTVMAPALATTRVRGMPDLIIAGATAIIITTSASKRMA